MIVNDVMKLNDGCFFQVDAVRVVHNDKLFKNNPDLEIFEKEYNANDNSGVIGSSEKCIDQVKQPCHTVEAVKLTEHDMKSVLEGLVKNLFGKKIKYRWVRSKIYHFILKFRFSL